MSFDEVKKLSIYVHVPFCVKKCLYCDFLSFKANEKSVEEYFSAINCEIILSSKEYKDYKVQSIFFGGGTPSYVEAGLICDTLSAIKEYFTVSDDAEISLEVNPASAIMDKLRAYKAAGFNRISIGAQSLNDEELKKLGRVHDSRMFFETFENARKAGFANINVDVMSALPDQSFGSYMATLSKVVDLRPEHISAYSLIIEEGTPFYDMDLNLPDEELDRQMYHETKRFLAANGYHRYEISNYALSAEDGSNEGSKETNMSLDEEAAYEKYECFHNKVYWKRGNYLGLGLGASSMVENTRWKNTSEIDRYKEILSKTDLEALREDEQILSEKECMEEFMFLGLRLTKGVKISAFKEQFGHEIDEIYGKIIEQYIGCGLLEKSDGYLYLTEKGLDVSNTVMADFLLD